MSEESSHRVLRDTLGLAGYEERCNHADVSLKHNGPARLNRTGKPVHRASRVGSPAGLNAIPNSLLHWRWPIEQISILFHHNQLA